MAGEKELPEASTPVRSGFWSKVVQSEAATADGLAADEPVDPLAPTVPAGDPHTAATTSQRQPPR